MFVRRMLVAIVFAASWCAAANARDRDGELHVPSPDWRDQVIYFAMIDRFDDGDPRNNDQGHGEFDPRSNAHYSGGDLKGLMRRLDYLQRLGATALWITPPVRHRWWDAQANYGGYHGYWGDHFKRVDPHFGRLRDYRRLSRALHGRGMYLVQDIVVNHMANGFHYDAGWDAADPTRGYRPNPDADGRAAPRQAPFDRNDPRDPTQRAAAIYHWTPSIRDHHDPDQERRFQLADLDDLNTESATVRRALRDSYGHWIRRVGVDAFRVDTAFHVPPDFFDDFLMADDRRAPGVLRVARDTGREDFHVFGEGFGIDRAFEDVQARKIDAYQRAAPGQAALPGMINFPLHGALLDVFARGQPPAVLAHRIASMMTLHADPWRMPSFVDNHDVDRFLASGDEVGLKQALLAMLTLPGIPVVYYGTEQGFREPRAAMFAAGYGSGGRDHFDPDAPLFRFLQQAIALRRSDPLFSRGRPRVLDAATNGPGLVAWRIDHEADAVLVLFNTADHRVLVDALDLGTGTPMRLEPRFATDAPCAALHSDAAGRVSTALDARAACVFRLQAAAPAPASSPAPGIDPIAEGPWREALPLTGTAPPGVELRLVVDGDLDRAVRVRADANGRWRAQVDTDSLIDARSLHHVVAWSPELGASPRRTFRSTRDWVLRADVADAAGDDHGPDGRYRYPTEAGYARLRPQDLRRVRVYSAGRALRVELEMAAISRAWNPPNGFDHAAFTLYFALPGRGSGAQVLPQQQARLPEGRSWHYRLRAHGWSNAWTAADGADAEREGRQHRPAPSITVLAETNTVRFEWPAAAFGDVHDWRGLRLYATTWDYDGGYRALDAESGAMSYGGGTPTSPRIMDASELIELR
jgi:glycosidase